MRSPFTNEGKAGGIVYNITIKVEPAIADQWLIWLKEEHIPAVMSTHCFTGFRVVKLMEVDDTDGPTYAVQFSAASLEEYTKYKKEFSSKLLRQSVQKWGQQFVAFESVMEVVH